MVAFWILLCVFLFFFGAAVYSFLNVVIFRVPRGEEFVKTRSHCPGCGRILTPMELVPVVSYICLGGKCKDCGSKIGLRDVTIEVFGGLSAIASILLYLSPLMGYQLVDRSLLQRWIGVETLESFLYGALLAGCAAFALVGILTVICFINIDTGKVKAGTLIALVVIGVMGVFALPKIELSSRGIGAACGLVPFLVLGLLSKNLNLSAGGVVLSVAGCVLGWRLLIVVAVLTVLIGAIWAICLLLTGNRKLEGRFRIVPVLCVSVVIAIFLGTQIGELLML